MSESPTYMSRAIRWALRCLLTYKACARRVQGRDVGSKCEFVGLRDPSEARAPGHFRAAPLPRQGLIFLPGPACPPALQHHPLQQMLGGPFANPLAFKAPPPPTPHPGPNCRGRGGGVLGHRGGAAPLLRPPLGCAASGSPHFPAGFAVFLSRPLPLAAASEIYCILT